MNYKNLILNELALVIDQDWEYNHEEKSPEHIEIIKFVYHFSYEFMKGKFEKTIKQYNSDEEKGADLFIAKRNIEHLNSFVEDVLPIIDKNLDDFDKRHKQKEFRNVIHMLNHLINYKGEEKF